jgi:hypothetical protein
MGCNGVMMGSRIVVSTEWVERMRRLVQAGVISIPVVSAAVRINAGQVMMAQAHQDLPQGVCGALGDGPEVRGMHETGTAGAGMSKPPKHHVLPNEHRGGSRSAASPAPWTSTSSASSLRRRTTNPSMAAATGVRVANGPRDGAR